MYYMITLYPQKYVQYLNMYYVQPHTPHVRGIECLFPDPEPASVPYGEFSCFSPNKAVTCRMAGLPSTQSECLLHQVYHRSRPHLPPRAGAGQGSLTTECISAHGWGLREARSVHRKCTPVSGPPHRSPISPCLRGLTA